MGKNKNAGILLGFLSMVPVITSYIVFYVMRGPNADIYKMILIYSILSLLGILLAVFSWILSNRILLPIIGLLGNVMVLLTAFFLLLAMGISEP